MRVFAAIATIMLAVGIALTSASKLPDMRPIKVQDVVVDDTPLHGHLQATKPADLPH
jgi:hypothetical protein